MTVSVAFNGTPINAADSLTGWTALKISGTGGGPSAAAADGSIEGSGAVTAQVSRQFVALYYDLGAGNELDFGVGGANEGQLIYIWGNFLAAALLNNQNANGLGIFLESSTPGTAQYHCWTFDGADTYAGGWKRFILDPTLSASTSSGTAINTGAIRYIGLFADVGGTTARFDNLIVDSIDVGTGLTVTGTSTLGLFEELVADETTNRYGVVTSLNESETAFQLAGKLVLGDTTTTSTISDEDSKVFIVEPKYYNGTAVVNSVPASFFGIDVVGGTGTQSLILGQEVGTTDGRNGVTIVGNDSYQFNIDFSDGNVETGDWLGCTLENVDGTLSFDSSSHKFRGNTLVQCGSISFVAGSTASDCSFVSSGQVVLNTTASLSSCSFTESTATAAVTTTEIENLSSCSFTKGTSGHAVELTSVGDGSMNWSCTASGYDAGVTGSDVAVTTPTGDETIYVNVGSGALTINVADGATIPSIRSAGATVDVVAGQRTFTVTVQDINTSSALQNARVYVTAAAGGGLAEGTVIIDRVLTNASGQVSDTRSYSSDQPYTGNVRLASSGVFYKSTTISGTISSSNDTDLTVSMIPDE
jgi:hypothetical protein